jgi:23S rRNA (adenine1618-N6)-methyltransferase
VSKPPQPASQGRRRLAGKGLHPRNWHNQGYDLTALAHSYPALKAHIARNAYGDLAIEYADASAVKTLNAALLKHHYKIAGWDIPTGALCPPVPGRADYLHYVAELLGVTQPTKVPAASSPIRLLDIGTGASGIYPLLACQLYGWHCVASDINQTSLDSVATTLQHNPRLKQHITLRRQEDKNNIFKDVIRAGEFYNLSVCNPPFHASADEAKKASQKKRRNLARQHNAHATTGLNFGGQAAELWCKGGERLFLKKMIKGPL